MKLLFFHGMTSTPDEVRPLKEFLEERSVQVCTPTLSGHLLSIKELRLVRTKTWLEDAEKSFKLCDTGDQLVVGGVSFGALLSLYLACKYPDRIKAVTLLSPTLVLRSASDEFLSNFLSYLPESILDYLPCREKHKRDINEFIVTRTAYQQHSIGAIARLCKIKRLLTKMQTKLPNSTKVYFAYCENDHLLESDQLVSRFHSYFGRLPDVVKTYSTASHEMLIGRSSQQVCQDIEQFLKGLENAP